MIIYRPFSNWRWWAFHNVFKFVACCDCYREYFCELTWRHCSITTESLLVTGNQLSLFFHADVRIIFRCRITTTTRIGTMGQNSVYQCVIYSPIKIIPSWFIFTSRNGPPPSLPSDERSLNENILLTFCIVASYWPYIPSHNTISVARRGICKTELTFSRVVNLPANFWWCKTN